MPHGAAIWSRNAGTNQTIDDNAYLAEGQSAPTLNNAVRGAMASWAECRDDNLGILVATKGVSETYAVTPYQGIPDLTQPFTLSFVVDTFNSAPARLAVGGLASKPLRRKFGREVGPGDITAGMLISVVWLPAADYFLITGPELEAPGILQHLAQASPENGWLKCVGQAISRTAYAALFAAIGTTYGAGDGTTTFNIPDFAGRTLFGTDEGTGRLTGAGGLAGTLGSVGGTQTVTLTTAQLPVHSFTATMDAQGGHSHTFAATTGTENQGHTHTYSGTTSGHSNDHAHNVTSSGTTDTVGDHAHTYSIAQASGGGLDGGTNFGYFNGYRAEATSATGAHAHNVTVSGTTAGVSANHTHTYSGTTGDISQLHVHQVSGTTATVAAHTHTITVSSIGSGAAHSNMPPAAVVTIAIKA